MFLLLEISDVVRVPASMLGKSLKHYTMHMLKNKYEGTINELDLTS